MKGKNNAILLLGSNIEPADNLKKALEMIDDTVVVKNRSQVWETEAIGSDGPNFLNLALEIETDLSIEDLKSKLIDYIESRLGRIRTADKYAPRTMDIDIIIFNNKIYDGNLWTRAFVAQPVADILPDLVNPDDHSTLKVTAEKLKSLTWVELYADKFL